MAQKYIISAVCLLAIVFTYTVHGKEITFKEEASGRVVSNPIDTNSDGLPASTGLYGAKSNLGPVTVHAFNETILAVSQTHCPPDTVELILDAHNIRRFENGDLLYTQSTEHSFICANLTTGEFHFESKLNFIGGTGKFKNATGTLLSVGTGTALVLDPNTLMNFSAITMNSKGKILLNKKSD